MHSLSELQNIYFEIQFMDSTFLLLFFTVIQQMLCRFEQLACCQLMNAEWREAQKTILISGKNCASKVRTTADI